MAQKKIYPYFHLSLYIFLNATTLHRDYEWL